MDGYRSLLSREVVPSPDIDSISSWIFFSGGARESSLGTIKEGLGKCELSTNEIYSCDLKVKLIINEPETYICFEKNVFIYIHL